MDAHGHAADDACLQELQPREPRAQLVGDVRALAPRDRLAERIAAEHGHGLVADDLAQVVRLDAIDEEEMTELVLDAWRMVVPKKVWRAYALTHDLPL